MTALSSSLNPDPNRLGISRRITRISGADGFIRVLAIDHPEDYLALLDPDVEAVGFDEVVQSKLAIAKALAPHTTAVLLDPVWSIGHAIATGTVPGDVGIISGLEELHYRPDSSRVGYASELTLRRGWEPMHLAALGCDAAKLLVFYRSEDSAAKNELLHAAVQDVAAACLPLQLPLIVEPLWYPVGDEDVTDPAVQQRRTTSVVESAGRFSRLGADIMKLQFPVSDARDPRAGDAVAEMAGGIDVPWVLLSAGVTFEAFQDQMGIALEHGCSGYIAGRSIWGDAVGRLDPVAQSAGLDRAAHRLESLNEMVRKSGKPSWQPTALDEVTDLVPETWCRTQAGLPPSSA